MWATESFVSLDGSLPLVLISGLRKSLIRYLRYPHLPPYWDLRRWDDGRRAVALG
jgi:hypothetical protein